jgi:hypothetical protein
VVCGACETDYSGYPDCRRSTLDAVEGALSLAVDGRVRVVTPLMALTKADTVRLARTLPGCWEALALSVTCYHGRRPGCGGCPACVLRSRGFTEAFEADPATYTQGSYRARAALGCPRCGASRVDGFVHCEKCRGYYAGRAARARSQYGKRRT